MTVYGIHSGSVYEGGGLGDCVFKDYSDARDQAKELVGVKQKEDEMVYGDEIEPHADWVDSDCPIHEWLEWRDDYWTNGIEEIIIKHLEVI